MFIILLLLLLSPVYRGHETNQVRGETDDLLRAETHKQREQIVSNATILETYEIAVQAYLDEDWDTCIQGFRDLTHKYTKYKNTVIKCRRICRAETEEPFKPLFRENIEELHFYEKKVRETLCILKCNQNYRELAGKNALKKMRQKEEWKLITADHYEYLHNCYFQKKYYQEAANAVFTYLIYHPNHKASKASLAYYMSLPEVNNASIRNLEAEPFVDDYMKGIKAYEEEYYEEAIVRFERSLSSYIESEERCRYYCEGPFEQGWNPDFTTAVSNHFVFNLHCKRRCSRILSTLNGEYRSGFLENHFNYFQFAYYKLGDIKKACEAVESYLLFYPADDTMLINKNYYISLPMVKEAYFKPRKEVIAYVKRQEYEKLLLFYINEEFNALEDKIMSSDSTSGQTAHVKASQDSVLVKSINISHKNESLLKTKESIHLTADKENLGGECRFLLEGLINQSECESIMRLAEMTTWEGDGYEKNRSPHSKFERFEGVTIGRLAVLVYFGFLKTEMLKLLLRVTESVREETEKIVKSNQHLYITYTHLVCRTALPGFPANRSDYSHNIHADNCLAEYDGSCHAESPAYVWRDYSSILYLNDNFEGGNFIFVKDKKASVIESAIRPECGRMLSFSSGATNLHGVTAVTKGKRCALGIWFTLQRRYEDLDRELAEAVVRNVEEEGPAQLVEASLNSRKSYENLKNVLLNKLIML